MKKKSFFKQNIIARQLVGKVAFYAGILAVFLTFAMGFFFSWIEANTFSRQLDEIQESYRDVIQNALWIEDKEMLDTILTGICSLPGIKYAHIHSKTGVICEAGNSNSLGKWARLFPIQHVYKGETVQLGEWHIQGDKNYLRKKTMNIIITIAIVQAVVIFLICCIILWIINDTVIQRVLKITSYTSSLFLENMDSPLVMPSKKKDLDELDFLSDGINKTRERLNQAYKREKKAQKELKRSHDLLEILVEQRTEKLNETVHQLKKALSEVKTLSGLLPICAHCKKIRDDKGYWNTLETYIEDHSDASFSHGMCSECSDKLYGDQPWYIEMKKDKRSGVSPRVEGSGKRAGS